MIRLAGMTMGSVVVLAIWIYALFDVIQTDEVLVRNLPKPMWILLVIFLPLVGSLVWLVAGRPLYAGFAPGGTDYQRPAARLAPEDRPDWNRPVPPGPDASELQRWEDDLARRERELRPPDPDTPGDPPELGTGSTD